jgi:hypothetical protein
MKTIQELYKKEIDKFIDEISSFVSEQYNKRNEIPFTAMGLIIVDGEYKTFILTGLDELMSSDSVDNKEVAQAIRKFNSELKPIVFAIVFEGKMFTGFYESQIVETETKVLTIKFETHDSEMIIAYNIEDSKFKKVDLDFCEKWVNKDLSKTDSSFHNLLSDNYSELAQILKDQLNHDLN